MMIVVVVVVVVDVYLLYFLCISARSFTTSSLVKKLGFDWTGE